MMTDVFATLALAVARALDHDLPDIIFTRPVHENGKRIEERECKRRPCLNDVEVHHFPQTWSDTSTGFGGVAGQAFTQAYTTVVICELTSAAVYFGGRRAYVLDPIINQNEFLKDLHAHAMASVENAKKYRS
jgi:hypothetical protein